MRVHLAIVLGTLAFGLASIYELRAGEKHEFATTHGETYKGELIGLYGGVVYIDMGRRGTAFLPYGALEEASREPVKAWFEDYLRQLGRNPTKVADSDSKLSSFLSNKLQVWNGDELVDYDFASETEPEFYAYYYSAHWCGPCRRFTPKLVEFYKEAKAAGHDNFEIVFVSSDTSGSMMEQYMKEDDMPWPAVKFGKRDHRLVAQYKGSGIPCLVVTDRHGRMMAHSYRGDEYLGPSKPKEMLRSLLQYTAELRAKAAQLAAR